MFRRVGTWAVRRSISPNSLSGISLLIALGAAAWFSGGAGQDSARGALGMTAWLAMLAIARALAVFITRSPAAERAIAARAHGGQAESFDWAWSVSAAAGECAIYGGMAAGNESAGLASTWPLAIGTVVAVATAELLGACVSAARAAEPAEPSGGPGSGLRWTAGSLRLTAAARGLTALLGFGVAGPDGAFVAVLAVSVLPIAFAVAMLERIAPPGERRVTARRPRSARQSAASSSSSNGALRGLLGDRTTTDGPVPRSVARATAQPAAASGIDIISGAGSRARSRGVPGPSAGGRLRGSAEPGEMNSASGITVDGGTAAPGGSEQHADVTSAAAPAGPSAAAYLADVAAAGGVASPDETRAGVPASRRLNSRSAAREVVLALRDDGAAARWAGRLVQGNLIPLPPALAGLVATSLLAVLGLRNLAAFVVLTPPLVMMLAAPGSSHPHDRRFDWLVPVLLALAQYVYLAPLGFALKVPGPVIFAACALIFLWYTGLIASSPAGSGWRTFIGWETRMFVIGLASAFGLATFGYLGLATYGGVLICRRVMTGYLVPREEDRQ